MLHALDRKLTVAIDGPAAAGKSTVARAVAKKLGYIYIDTGAMYRSVALMALRAGLDIDRQADIVALTEDLDIQLTNGQEQQVIVNGENVTSQIRTPEVTALTAQIATIEAVRRILVSKQRELAAAGGVVMDGRDIGSRVLPDADVKIFMTASVEHRARRRYDELKQKGETVTFEQILADMKKRDESDRTRDVSPLVVPADAHVIDTTELTADQVVETVVRFCRDVSAR